MHATLDLDPNNLAHRPADRQRFDFDKAANLWPTESTEHQPATLGMALEVTRPNETRTGAEQQLSLCKHGGGKKRRKKGVVAAVRPETHNDPGACNFKAQHVPIGPTTGADAGPGAE